MRKILLAIVCMFSMITVCAESYSNKVFEIPSESISSIQHSSNIYGGSLNYASPNSGYFALGPGIYTLNYSFNGNSDSMHLYQLYFETSLYGCLCIMNYQGEDNFVFQLDTTVTFHLSFLESEGYCTWYISRSNSTL